MLLWVEWSISHQYLINKATLYAVVNYKTMFRHRGILSFIIAVVLSVFSDSLKEDYPVTLDGRVIYIVY